MNVNSLWPSDAIRWEGTESTLTQVFSARLAWYLHSFTITLTSLKCACCVVKLLCYARIVSLQYYYRIIFLFSLKVRGRRFVGAGGTVSCQYDKLQCYTTADGVVYRLDDPCFECSFNMIFSLYYNDMKLASGPRYHQHWYIYNTDDKSGPVYVMIWHGASYKSLAKHRPILGKKVFAHNSNPTKYSFAIILYGAIRSLKIHMPQ